MTKVHSVKMDGAWPDTFQALEPRDLELVRESWEMAKQAAPLEVHGPGIFRLWVLYKQFGYGFYRGYVGCNGCDGGGKG